MELLRLKRAGFGLAPPGGHTIVGVEFFIRDLCKKGLTALLCLKICDRRNKLVVLSYTHARCSPRLVQRLAIASLAHRENLTARGPSNVGNNSSVCAVSYCVLHDERPPLMAWERYCPRTTQPGAIKC